MTNIVVLIKQVPDTWSERKLSDGDYTLDREAADAVLDLARAYGIEVSEFDDQAVHVSAPSDTYHY